MKRYKHKITGKVFIETDFYNPEAPSEKYYKLDSVARSFYLDKEFIVNSNDWEEVLVENTFSRDVFNQPKEEPNYLITAFRDLRGGYATDIWKITSEGKYCKNEYAPVSLNHMINTGECVNNGKFEIYSVKNSKGEEFTIGDKINASTLKNATIKSFKIIDKSMVVYCDIKTNFLDLEWCSIAIQSPIYTTTDGVEIEEGQSIRLFLLNKDLTTPMSSAVDIIKFRDIDKPVADRFLTFINIENRDKYIKENSKKPIFVSADNVEFYDNNTDYSLFSVLPKANWQEGRYRLNDIVKWPKKEWLHFHAKEARQEYIDNNKPKYSLADVFMASEKIPSGHLITTGMLDQLKKLGK